jgi:hypothetical protein
MQRPEDSYNAIWNHQKAIVEIYKEKDLSSLAGIDYTFKVNGRQVLKWFFEVVRKGQIKYSNKNFHALFDDIIVCSDEILFFTAQLYLYAPYMNDPFKDAYDLAGKMIYPNFQNLEAKRFSMFASITSEKIYNYWDRIGDLIEIYFPGRLSEKQVYFPAVIDCVDKAFHQSENYKWLKEFKETDYKQLNEIRRRVVHYLTHETEFKRKHLDSVDSEQAVLELVDERNSLPDQYRGHIKTTIEGFDRAVLLIEEVTSATLSDID